MGQFGPAELCSAVCGGQWVPENGVVIDIRFGDATRIAIDGKVDRPHVEWRTGDHVIVWLHEASPNGSDIELEFVGLPGQHGCVQAGGQELVVALGPGPIRERTETDHPRAIRQGLWDRRRHEIAIVVIHGGALEVVHPPRNAVEVLVEPLGAARVLFERTVVDEVGHWRREHAWARHCIVQIHQTIAIVIDAVVADLLRYQALCHYDAQHHPPRAQQRCAPRSTQWSGDVQGCDHVLLDHQA